MHRNTYLENIVCSLIPGASYGNKTSAIDETFWCKPILYARL